MFMTSLLLFYSCSKDEETDIVTSHEEEISDKSDSFEGGLLDEDYVERCYEEYGSVEIYQGNISIVGQEELEVFMEVPYQIIEGNVSITGCNDLTSFCPAWFLIDRFSSAFHEHPSLNQGEHLIETWEEIVVFSRYTGHVTILQYAFRRPVTCYCPKFVLTKHRDRMTSCLTYGIPSKNIEPDEPSDSQTQIET